MNKQSSLLQNNKNTNKKTTYTSITIGEKIWQAQIICSETKKIIKVSKNLYKTLYDAQSASERMLNKFRAIDYIENNVTSVSAEQVVVS